MKKLTFILLVILAQNCLGQIYFNHQHYGDWYKTIERIDSSYYCTYSDLFYPTIQDEGICILNDYGDTVKTIHVPLLNGNSYTSSFDKQSRRIYFTCNQKVSINVSGSPIILKTNYNGDTLLTKRFNTGITARMSVYGVKVVNSNEILVLGTYKPDTSSAATNWNSDIILMRLDSLFNVIWLKVYGTSLIERPFSYWGFGANVLILNDGNILLSAESCVSGYTNYFNKYKSLLIKFDNTTGNVLLTKTTSLPNNAYHIICVKQLPDNSIIANSYKSWDYDDVNWPPDTSDYSFGYILKLDSNFQKVWEKKYTQQLSENSFFPKMYSDATGYYFFDFKNNYSSWIGPDKSEAYLIHTDFNGDSIWTRHILTENHNTLYAQDWVQNEDKGFTICGLNENVADYNSQRWIMRIDSMGYTDTTVISPPPVDPDTIQNQPPPPIDSTNSTTNAKDSITQMLARADGLLLSPNPSNDKITITTKDTILQVQLFNVSGKQVFNQKYNGYNSQFDIDIATIDGGIYFLLLQRKAMLPVRKKILIMR